MTSLVPLSDPRVNHYINGHIEKLQDMDDFNALNILNQLDDIWQYIRTLEIQIIALNKKTATLPAPDALAQAAAPEGKPFSDPATCELCGGELRRKLGTIICDTCGSEYRRVPDKYDAPAAPEDN